MKKLSVLLVTVLVAISVVGSSCDSKRNPSLTKGIDSVSYAIGLANGDMFRSSLTNFPGDEPINVDALIAGFAQGLHNDTASYKMKVTDAQQFINTYVQEVQERMMNKTKEEGEAFLNENKTKPGVITTESGLQYQVITEGDGPRPTPDNRVKVHYTGTLLDGTVFDSSVDRGEPATFMASNLIEGWKEGLQIMPVGSKYIFWIPANLAYGPRGQGNIPPNSVLKFELELLEIVE